MRGLINKKGAAHFEMIFSFVFFVGFVFFLFMVLKPQDTSTLSSSVIEALYDSFEEEVYTDLTSTVLKTPTYTDNTKNCFMITLPGEIFTYALTESYVTTLGDVDVESDLAPAGTDNLEVNKNGNFFRVSISSEFDDDEINDCESLNNYELGSILERRVVSYNALKNMTERYRVDYEGLRADLKVPPIFDFAIIAEDLPGIVMEPQLGVPTSGEVRARDYIVEVLRSTGEVSNERFTLKIW